MFFIFSGISPMTFTGNIPGLKEFLSAKNLKNDLPGC
jgi:hypothetical protein